MLQEPEVERHEDQDNTDVYRQALPEVVPEEQDVHADHDAYKRKYIKNGCCLSSHRIVLLCGPDDGKKGAPGALTAGPCYWRAGSRAAAALPLAPNGAPHG